MYYINTVAPGDTTVTSQSLLSWSLHYWGTPIKHYLEIKAVKIRHYYATEGEGGTIPG